VLAAIVAAAATTGLRRGELAGLRSSDNDGGWASGPTKAHQVRRTALDNVTVAAIRLHATEMERAAYRAWYHHRRRRIRLHPGPERHESNNARQTERKLHHRRAVACHTRTRVTSAGCPGRAKSLYRLSIL
jgi:integrase